MYRHKDKSGKYYRLSELADDHLDNIIRRIERLSVEGITIRIGGGTDPDDFWMDDEDMFGDEAKAYMNYGEYIEERNRRNRLKSMINLSRSKNHTNLY